MDVLKIVGAGGKTILCKDGKVKIIIAGGLFSTKREKVIPASNISGIEVKKPGGMLNGYIQVQVAGQLSSNNARGGSGGLSDAMHDENSVVFSGEDNYKTAKQIQAHILEFHANASRPTTSASISVADELLKLKQLEDDGVISRDEFDAMKTKLLNK